MGFRLSENEAWAMISSAHESVLTTLRSDGRPISLPVWHVVLDDAIYVTTPSSSKKVIRVRKDPRGSLLVRSGEAWAELKAVVAEVRVSIIDEEQVVAAVASAMDEKYATVRPPMDRLPPQVRTAYDDMATLRLDVTGPFRSWDNSALLGG